MNLNIRTAWSRYRALPRVPRELVTIGLSLAFALTLLPICIWLAGQYFLGDYLRDPSGSSRGGIFALILDYGRGVAAGSLGHWVVLLGPYAMLVALRCGRYFVRM